MSIHYAVLGELGKAIRDGTSLRFGLYHSLYEWYHPLYLHDKMNNFTTNKYTAVSIVLNVGQVTKMWLSCYLVLLSYLIRMICLFCIHKYVWTAESTVKPLIKVAANSKTQMFLVSSCSCLWPIHWSQVLSQEWRCSYTFKFQVDLLIHACLDLRKLQIFTILYFLRRSWCRNFVN